MHKNLLWLLLLTSTALKAQVSMTVQVAPEGIIQKPQLWNFLVVNNENAPVQVKISLSMTDVQTNDPVLTASSAAVFVNSGATPLLAANLSPIQYEYLSSRVTDPDPNGFLPIGQYQVCYTLFVYGHIGFEEASQECISVFVEPISPPMLSLPFDGSEDETTTPQFSWLPPAPLNMFNNLTYDFKLVEVAEGQTATEAIQQNMPVYTVSNHPDIFLNYPSSHTPLDTGKVYAWQVFANNNNVYAAQSEVWTFKPATILSDTISKELIQYFVFKEFDEQQPIYSIKTNKISFKFYSWMQAGTANFLIKDEGENIVSDKQINIIYGDNYITFPLEFSPVAEKVYTISMKDEEERLYTIKFMLINE
jgi:hypothetical protein